MLGMPKNKMLMLIGLAAATVIVVAGLIWASSTRQTETTLETQDEDVSGYDMSDEEMETIDDSASIPPAPVPPTTVTPPGTTPPPPPPPPQPLPPPTPPPAPLPPPSASTVNVSITNFAYSPAELRITQGTTVVWTNDDSVGHTVTSESGTELDSVLFSKGQTFSHTFNTAGEFNYLCTPHPWMKGKIIVE